MAKAYFDESTGLTLDPELVDDAGKEELCSMRRLASLPRGVGERSERIWAASSRHKMDLHKLRARVAQ